VAKDKRKKGKAMMVREAAVAHGEIEVTATDFKTHCLALIDRIRETGETLVVTRHGEPVARVEGYEEAIPVVSDAMKGTVLFYESPTEPTGEEWEAYPHSAGE
jgi:prevent-host-death family protein